MVSRGGKVTRGSALLAGARRGWNAAVMLLSGIMRGGWSSSIGPVELP
jgi:hypothetical protein